MDAQTTQQRRWWSLLGLSAVSAFSFGLVVSPDLLFAGVFIKSPPRFGPAPLIGVGLPVAGAVVAVVLAARRYLHKR
jgi:hypothetical protein